jgi:predicted nucleotidyltransferase
MAQRVGAGEHGPWPALDTVRRVVAEVAREAGYRLVVLFGSAARGEPAEDLDLGILARGPLDAVAATNRLTPALGTQAVDVADLGRADPLLLMLVARDGVPLYEASPGEFARFASLAARRFFDTRKFREVEREMIGEFVAQHEAGLKSEPRQGAAG